MTPRQRTWPSGTEKCRQGLRLRAKQQDAIRGSGIGDVEAGTSAGCSGVGCIVGAVVWLILSPGVLAALVLSVGLVILVIAALSPLRRFTAPDIEVPDPATQRADRDPMTGAYSWERGHTVVPELAGVTDG